MTRDQREALGGKTQGTTSTPILGRGGDPAPPALEARDLSHTYRGGGEPVPAIGRLDLVVRQGEFVAVVGPSGCGKSTLLKLASGLLVPTDGQLMVAGAPVDGPVHELGMVFQQPVLLPWRSALDNVLLPLELMGRNPKTRSGRARELLAEVGLAGFEDRLPRELSGGMQQRVAICRALINDPALLLMDEPFSALDELAREGLNDQLLQLWRHERSTVIFVTHSVGEAVYLADRVVVLTARPARLVTVVDVPLGRPRLGEVRYDPAFIDTARRIRELLRT